MNETRIRVIPVEGRKVRHLDGRELAAGGEMVEPSAYWRRKEMAGDVTVAAPATTATTASPAESTTETVAATRTAAKKRGAKA